MKRAIIVGGSGQMGRALTDELVKREYQVIILSRKPDKARGLPDGAREERWDGRTAERITKVVLDYTGGN